MTYEKMTAAQAVLHFAKNGYNIKRYEMNEQRERDRVRKIIDDANKGRVSDKRARGLLEMYGGEAYRCTTAFEVAVTDPNAQTFAELASAFRAKHPNSFGLDEEVK